MVTLAPLMTECIAINVKNEIKNIINETKNHYIDKVSKINKELRQAFLSRVHQFLAH